jgi:hypothetical protein
MSPPRRSRRRICVIDPAGSGGVYARLLPHPGAVGVARAGHVLDPAAADADEDEYVQSLQQDSVDGEEVAGERRCGMLAQERAPVLLVALGCRRNTCRFQDVAYQRGGDADAEFAQLTDDPDIAPAGVLARHSQDEFAHLASDRRSAGTPVRVRPVARNEAAMPAQQRLRSRQKRPPRTARQHPTERGEHEPVARLEPRPAHLSAQDRQLVSQHEDLEFLRAVAACEQKTSSNNRQATT